MGPDAMILPFWTLNFKPTFSLSFFTLKMLFSSSSFLSFRVVTSAYLRLDISPGNLDSSLWFSQAFISHDVLCIDIKLARWQYTALMYSFPNLEPVCCSMSSSNCCFLTCCYRFLRRQVRWSGIPISWRINQFIMIHTVKGFSLVNESDFFSGIPMLSLWPGLPSWLNW